LRVPGFGQFRFRPVKANTSKVITQDGVGAVEPRSGGGKFFRKVPAHADNLRALSGKEKCGFAH
jgi:hypothetical protein